MKLDWLILANSAEEANGLVHMLGAGWDTINVRAPLHEPDGSPSDIVAVVQGTLIARLLLHPTETARDHPFELTIVDEDGATILKMEGAFRVDPSSAVPPSWDHGMNLVMPLTGLQLPRFGLYQVSLIVNQTHYGERPFRVVKAY